MKVRKLFKTLLFPCVIVLASNVAAQDLTGQWKSVEIGVSVNVLQQGNVVLFFAAEDSPRTGYDTMKKGEKIGEGTFKDGLFKGTGVFFAHETAVRKCGLSRRGTSSMFLTLAKDGSRLSGTESAKDIIPNNGCAMALKTFQTSYIRISAPVTTAGTSTGAVACLSNFSTQGAKVSGTLYTTNAVVKGVTKADAVTRAAKKLAADGLVVITADIDAGLVIAANRVANTKEESILEVNIEEVGVDHLNVAMKFPLRAGLLSSGSVIRDRMCQVIAATEE